MDGRGRHALCECRSGGGKIRRHNNVARFIERHAKFAGHQVRAEQHVAGVGKERHADLLVFRPNGVTEVVDVAITYGGQTVQQQQTVANNDDHHTYFADTYSHLHKDNKYKAAVEKDKQYTFVPVVANHWGGWSAQAYKWLSKLGAEVNTRVQGEGGHSHQATTSLFVQLSVAIQKENARMIVMRRSPQDMDMENAVMSAGVCDGV